VAIPLGEAGQTKAGIVMRSRVRTIAQARIRGRPLGVVTAAATRRRVRRVLTHHLGLDIPGVGDGAT
jgi:predicted Ser/Thr protein kinase